MKRPAQNPASVPPVKQQRVQTSSSSSPVNFSEEDWKIFQEAIVNFAAIQREIFQDFILWDLYYEEIPPQKRQLLWDLIQGKIYPSQIYPCNIFTAYIYCSAISLGLENINHPYHFFWSQKAHQLILMMMSGGGIEQLEHENQKLIVIDHLVKEIYYNIRHSNFWTAKFLYSQANLISLLTDKTKLIQHTHTPVMNPELPIFINLHLGVLKIWTMKSIPEKITMLKSLLSDVPRVQTGTSVITGLILSCESEEVYNSLMKAANPVPLEPSYADTVWEYLTAIWEDHNIDKATPEMQLVFYLSLALLKIRNIETLPTSKGYLNQALERLKKVNDCDSTTTWYCGIGLSLSILCEESQLLFSFQREYQRLYDIYSIPWEEKYQLTEKILALSLEPPPDH